MNKSKEGETGRSECEVTKSRCLEAEELREICDLSWKSSFQNKLGPVVCIKISTDQSGFFFFFLEHSSDPSNGLSLLLLPPGSHTVPSCSALYIQKRFVL